MFAIIYDLIYTSKSGTVKIPIVKVFQKVFFYVVKKEKDIECNTKILLEIRGKIRIRISRILIKMHV